VHDGRRAIERQRIAHDVAFNEPEPRLAAQGGEVALLDGARIERVEVVEPDDLVPRRGQPFAQVRADEPRRTRHDDTLAHPWSCSRK
jgi:hypothetical protein